MSTCCLRRTVRICAFFDSGCSSCVSPRWLQWLHHTCSCEGVPRILRLILGRSHGFPVSPSRSAATGSVFLPCGGVQETLDLLGDDFRNFPYCRYVSCPLGRGLAPVARQHGRYGPEGQLRGVCSKSSKSLSWRRQWLLSFRDSPVAHIWWSMSLVRSSSWFYRLLTCPSHRTKERVPHIDLSTGGPRPLPRRR